MSGLKHMQLAINQCSTVYYECVCVCVLSSASRLKIKVLRHSTAAPNIIHHNWQREDISLLVHLRQLFRHGNVPCRKNVNCVQ